MQELSLNILDVAQNSIKAKATLIEILIAKQSVDHTMRITIRDNGSGMSEEQIQKVIDPFYTTRTTRKVGLGVPFFKMSAELTGGDFSIQSTLGMGTTVTAFYHTDHIDLMPLGDIAQTMTALISVNTEVRFVYTYQIDQKQFTLDTDEIKNVLEGVEINTPDVLLFIGDFINENQQQLETNLN